MSFLGVENVLILGRITERRIRRFVCVMERCLLNVELQYIEKHYVESMYCNSMSCCMPFTLHRMH